MQTILIFFSIFGIYTLIFNLFIYTAAKLNGVRVDKFYIGYDVFFSLLKVKIKETEFGIGWLPIGSYVKISGMNLSEEEEIQPYHFEKLSVIRQFFIVILGPLSFLVGFLLTLIFYGELTTHGLNEILGFTCFTLSCYFLLITFGPIVFEKWKHSKFKNISVYSLLVSFQVLIVYIYSVLINKIFPLYHFIKKVFIEKNRVHFFYQEYESINLKILICSIGLVFFFYNLLPTGSQVFNVVYKGVTGERVSTKVIKYTSIIGGPVYLIFVGYLAYFLLF